MTKGMTKEKINPPKCSRLSYHHNHDNIDYGNDQFFFFDYHHHNRNGNKPKNITFMKRQKKRRTKKKYDLFPIIIDFRTKQNKQE